MPEITREQIEEVRAWMEAAKTCSGQTCSRIPQNGLCEHERMVLDDVEEYTGNLLAALDAATARIEELEAHIIAEQSIAPVVESGWVDASNEADTKEITP